MINIALSVFQNGRNKMECYDDYRKKPLTGSSVTHYSKNGHHTTIPKDYHKTHTAMKYNSSHVKSQEQTTINHTAYKKLQSILLASSLLRKT